MLREANSLLLQIFRPAIMKKFRSIRSGLESAIQQLVQIRECVLESNLGIVNEIYRPIMDGGVRYWTKGSCLLLKHHS
jgi:hypothetical protein